MFTLPPLTLLTLSSALTVGVVFALLAHIKQRLVRRPQPADQPFMLTAGVNASLIPLFFVAGLSADLWGVRPTLLAGSVLLTLSFLAFSVRLTSWRQQIAIVAAALGGSALFLTNLVLMPFGLLGRDQVAASLQLGLVFVALGALITQPLFAALGRLGSQRRMAIMALVVLMPAFLAALPAGGDFPAHVDNGHSPLLHQDLVVWLAGLAFCCYAPLEAFISIWITSEGQDEAALDRQSVWLGFFWASLLVSRLLVALAQHAGAGDEFVSHVLVGLSLLSAVLLGNMASTIRRGSPVAWLIGLGLAMGPIYPLLLGLLSYQASVNRMPATAYAILHALGSGSCLLLLLVGPTAPSRTTGSRLRIAILLAMALTITMLLFVLAPRADHY